MTILSALGMSFKHDLFNFGREIIDKHELYRDNLGIDLTSLARLNRFSGDRSRAGKESPKITASTFAALLYCRVWELPTGFLAFFAYASGF
ncbi:MAG: hypothetical protein AAGN35_15080 [Bacteroidota bacterium]